ncbi:MAG: redoxin family protein [Pirellulales bacterium]
MRNRLFTVALLVLSTVAVGSGLNAAAAADEPYQLIGRVTDDSGQPVAGAVVRVMIAPGLTSGDSRIRTGTSDEQGNYAVAVPPGHAMCLAPEPPGGFFFTNVGLLQFSTTASQPAHTLDFKLERGVPLPLEFESGLEAAASVYLFRQAPTHFSYIRQTSNATSIIVTLPPDGGKISLAVLDKSFRPLAQIKIEMPEGFDPARVENITNSDDARAEAVDAAGRKAVFHGASATAKDGQTTVRVKPGRIDAASRTVWITGRVVDSQDRPVAGAEVRFGHAGNGGSNSSSFATVSGADGGFALDAQVGSGAGKETPRFFLIVTRDGTAGAVTENAAIPAGKDTVEVAPIKLAEGNSLRLRVVDEAGQPLEGAWIEPGEAYLSAANFVRTDGEGRCEARNLPAGVVRISARYGSLYYNEKIVVDDQAAGDEITLRLKPLQQAQAQPEPIPEPPPLGAPAPEWSIVGWTDGKTRKLSDYRGKVVVLDFWGIWCSACLNGIGAEKVIEAKYADNPDVVFLGIHSGGADMAQVQALKRVKDWPLVTGIDEGPDTSEGKTARAYGARGWPTTVIIDREGKIAYNSNLEKWNQVTVALELARIAKALKLPREKPGASQEEQISRSNAMSAYRLSELLDRVLGEKSP